MTFQHIVFLSFLFRSVDVRIGFASKINCLHAVVRSSHFEDEPRNMIFFPRNDHPLEGNEVFLQKTSPNAPSSITGTQSYRLFQSLWFVPVVLVLMHLGKDSFLNSHHNSFLAELME